MDTIGRGRHFLKAFDRLPVRVSCGLVRKHPPKRSRSAHVDSFYPHRPFPIREGPSWSHGLFPWGCV